MLAGPPASCLILAGLVPVGDTGTFSVLPITELSRLADRDGYPRVVGPRDRRMRLKWQHSIALGSSATGASVRVVAHVVVSECGLTAPGKPSGYGRNVSLGGVVFRPSAWPLASSERSSASATMQMMSNFTIVRLQ